MKKLLILTIPATAAASIVLLIVVEVTIRATWDDARGRPGLFSSDPVRIEKLSASYDGWFAGVPVRTNALGFRDSREYRLNKEPHTFRIIVLGDSVTFGHGSVYEHTYPYLLEQRLKAWKPEVDWQVWNLGVPGYNTSQELAYLLEVGPAYRPDIVIVGFFWNDLIDNRPIQTPTRRAVAASEMKTWLRRHMVSFDWYKKQYLTLRHRLSASGTERDLLDNLLVQERLLAKPSEVAGLEEQRLTHPTPRTDAQLELERCTSPPPPLFSSRDLERTPGFAAWQATVRRLQDLHRAGTCSIVFFVNAAPEKCQVEDLFVSRGTKPLDDYYLRILSDGTPAVSSFDAFLRYRPSEMPIAVSHSIGNSNDVKAGVLFDFLRDRVLPPLVGRPQTHAS